MNAPSTQILTLGTVLPKRKNRALREWMILSLGQQKYKMHFISV